MKKTFLLKKAAAMILALLMIVSTLVVLPITASATEAVKGWADSDTTNKIYYIATVADMESFANDTTAQAGATIYLTADIDMSTSTGWEPIASFYGTFDGQGHTIKNLTVTNQAVFINETTEGQDTTIKNVTFDTCNLTVTTGYSAVVVGRAKGNKVLISNVDVKNSEIVDSEGATNFRFAAVVGRADALDLIVEECAITDTFIELNNRHSASGVVATVFAGSTTISKVFCNATVTGVTGNTGGMIGWLVGGKVTLNKCVFAGTAGDTGASPNNTGGLVGLVGGAGDAYNPSLTITDCAHYGSLVLAGNSNSNAAVGGQGDATTMTNCVTTADLVAQKDALLAAGWVEINESVMVDGGKVALLVPDEMFAAYLDLPFYSSSCATKLPDMSTMLEIAELANKDATEIWQGGDKTSWGTDEKVTLDATKTHMTFSFTAPQKATYYVAVQYGKTAADASKAQYVGFQIDSLDVDQVALTQSADADQWMIVALELNEGDHTFTVSAPANLGSADVNGKTVTSAELLTYKVWTKNTAPAYEYNYTFEEKLTDTFPAVIVLDGGVADATDSWDMEKTAEWAAGSPVCLKPDFDPPRTHLTFTFEAETAGDYKFAIEYTAAVNIAYDRSVDVQIDKLGRTRVSLQQSNAKLYVVITEHLEAGSHTFTVYAPDAFGSNNSDGKTIMSADLYSFMVYMPVNADSLLSMVDGAAVKLASTSALRYTTRVDKALYDYVVELYGAENVTVGTLFGKASDVAIAGALTKEAFNIEALTYHDSGNGELLEDENGYYFYGYWEEDDTSKYDTMMAAVGYIRIKIEGKSNYLYVSYNADNDRSIAMVAERALADTKSASEAGYENSVTVNGTVAYSPYTSKQYACLVELAAYKKK